MNKLTAEECRLLIDSLSGNRSIREDKYLAALEIALPILERRENGDDGWIYLDGGNQPVPSSTPVEVKFRKGTTNHKELAGSWDWTIRDENPDDYDIIAYRVIENDGREGEK